MTSKAFITKLDGVYGQWEEAQGQTLAYPVRYPFVLSFAPTRDSSGRLRVVSQSEDTRLLGTRNGVAMIALESLVSVRNLDSYCGFVRYAYPNYSVFQILSRNCHI
jgi:hypothetical protein